jgi:hypothetical protein
MPDGTVGYAWSFSPEAGKVRKELSRELLLKLLDVVDDLARNPDAYPERARSLGTRGDMFLYVHPEPPFEITYEIDRANRKIYFVHFAARIVELKRVFVSYSHEDLKWLERLRKFLIPLENQGLIRIWDDSKIQVGSDWQAEIGKALESAKAAVFLVTQDFLNSPFIQAREIPPLLEKAHQEGVKIIWVAVKSCTVKDSVIFKFQAANDPERPLEMLDEPQRNKVFTEIYEKIKAALAA